MGGVRGVVAGRELTPERGPRGAGVTLLDWNHAAFIGNPAADLSARSAERWLPATGVTDDIAGYTPG